MDGGPPRVAALLLTAGVVLTAVDAYLAVRLSTRSGWYRTNEILQMAAWLSAGHLATRIAHRGRIGLLMLGLGLVLAGDCAVGLGLPAGAVPDVVVLASGLVFGLQLPLGGLIFLTYPSGRTWDTAERVYLRVAGVLSCASAVVLVLTEGAARQAAWQANTIGSLVAVTVGLVLFARRLRRLSRRERRVLRPPMIGILGAVLSFALWQSSFGLHLTGVLHWSLPVVEIFQTSSVIAVPATFVLGLLRQRWDEAAVARLLRELRRIPAEALQPALRRALGDPDLRLLLPGDPGFATGDPGSATCDAGSATGDAGFATGDPGFATGDPGSATGDPGSATGDPGSDTGDLGFDTGRPGDLPGGRPADLPADRAAGRAAGRSAGRADGVPAGRRAVRDDQAGPATTPIGDAGAPLAVLRHDRSLLAEPELIEAVREAVHFSLDLTRLEAALRHQQAEVTATSRRLVEAGDSARRRIERDLHDGAQQRLLTAGLALQLLRHNLVDADERTLRLLADAEAELRTAMAELRELAHGIHPAVLTSHGLSGALADLATRAPVRVRLELSDPLPPLTSDVEATAYFIACEALANVVKHAQATTVGIAARQQQAWLELAVTDDGRGGATLGSGLSGLRDRVLAVGGTITLTSPPGGGTTLEAHLPCD